MKAIILSLLSTCLVGSLAVAQQSTNAATNAEEQRFVGAVKQAYEKHDLEQLKKLVYWEGADAKARALMEDLLKDGFDEKPTRITISNASALSISMYLDMPELGEGSRLSLPPTKEITFVSRKPPTSRFGSTTTEEGKLLLGYKDGKLYFACPVSPKK